MQAANGRTSSTPVLHAGDFILSRCGRLSAAFISRFKKASLDFAGDLHR